MQEQVCTQHEQLHSSPVKASPFIKGFLLHVIALGVLSASDWLVTIVAIFFARHMPTFSFTSAVFFTFFLFRESIATVHFYKRFEQKRQAAAQGNHRLLADAQPVPDVQALPLPIIIGIRHRWRVLIGLPVSIIFLFLGGLFALLSSSPDTAAIPIPFIIFYLSLGGVMLIGAVAGSVFKYRRDHKQIILTEYGIMQVGISPKIQSIPWSEVRLFAISSAAAPASQQILNRPPMMVELASADEVIQWHWLREKGSYYLYPARPSTSPVDYEQQMRSILAVIRAKTGLSLFDLRLSL